MKKQWPRHLISSKLAFMRFHWIFVFIWVPLLSITLGCESGNAPSPKDNQRLVTNTEQYEDYTPEDPPFPPPLSPCQYFPDCDGDGRAAAFAQPLQGMCGTFPVDPPSDDCIAWTIKNPLRLNQVDCNDNVENDFEDPDEQNCDPCRGFKLSQLWPSCDGDVFAPGNHEGLNVVGCAPAFEGIPTSNDTWVSKTPITDFCPLEDGRGRPLHPRWTPLDPHQLIFGRNEYRDCDDTDIRAFPGSVREDLCDGKDNDCDGEKDEDAENLTSWFADCDGDTYPSVRRDERYPNERSKTTQSCLPRSGTRIFHIAIERSCLGLENCQPDDPNKTCQWVNHINPTSNNAEGLRDCDDRNPRRNPGVNGRDRCNGIDDDCDEVTDENPLFLESFTADCDGDGFAGGIFDVEDESFSLEMCHDGFLNVFPDNEIDQQLSMACNRRVENARWIKWDEDDEFDSAPFDPEIH